MICGMVSEDEEPAGEHKWGWRESIKRKSQRGAEKGKNTLCPLWVLKLHTLYILIAMAALHRHYIQRMSAYTGGPGIIAFFE